jgi:putrescine aminotransferase
MDPEAPYREVVERYRLHINPTLAKLMSFAGFGLEVRAEGTTIYDHEGRAYIDCLGGYGVFALGHRHPRIVQAVKDQLDRMPLSGKAFFSSPTAELAQKLAELAPGDLTYTFFSNSGAEAVECALKFARGATGRPEFVAAQGGYHGKTLGALSVTGREKYQKAFAPLLPGVRFVPYGDAQALQAAVSEQTAGVILEPIQGEGGILLPPPGYLAEARGICDRAGALLILDEVQTGMGRTGRMFACEHVHVTPDLMCLAKALGGGVMPIGATMGTAAVFERVFAHNPLAHTSTFGGNALACAAGLATLEVLREENLLDRAATIGERLLRGFQKVGERTSLIREIRGKGMMIGVEFAEDEVGELVVAQLLKRGVCVAYALNNPRVLRFEPPLVLSEADADRVIDALDEAVAETDSLLAEVA